jgi:hypothetical protein
MRVFTVSGTQVQASLGLPGQLPEQGFVWIACSRNAFATELDTIQATLERLTGQGLVDLHVSDLLNAQLPSHFDFSAQYDLMVFRRLAQREPGPAPGNPASVGKRPGPPVLQRIVTSPVGFAVFDRVLLSVHPDDCAVREAYASRLLNATGDKNLAHDPRSAGARGIPLSPADMMLRIVSQMVDAYLDLRRELSRQLDHWVAALKAIETRAGEMPVILPGHGEPTAPASLAGLVGYLQAVKPLLVANIGKEDQAKAITEEIARAFPDYRIPPLLTLGLSRALKA